MGYESNQKKADAAIDRSQDKFRHPTLLQAHKEADAFLNKESIDPMDFLELYGDDNVIRDLRKVDELKTKFEGDTSKIASRVFEAIMHQHIEQSNWLGANARTIRTSEYDDFINGVDLVATFRDEASMSHLALGVDITFGSLSMQKKFDRIKNDIQNNKLADVKYFEAPGYKGSLNQVPRVVIGVDIDKVIALAGLWGRNDNKSLAEHVTKDIIADEIEKQVRAFMMFAKVQRKEEVAEAYSRAYNTIRKMHTVANGFSDEKNRMQVVHDDNVYKAIMEHLKFFTTSSRPG